MSRGVSVFALVPHEYNFRIHQRLSPHEVGLIYEIFFNLSIKIVRFLIFFLINDLLGILETYYIDNYNITHLKFIKNYPPASV